MHSNSQVTDYTLCIKHMHSNSPVTDYTLCIKHMHSNSPVTDYTLCIKHMHSNSPVTDSKVIVHLCNIMGRMSEKPESSKYIHVYSAIYIVIIISRQQLMCYTCI